MNENNLVRLRERLRLDDPAVVNALHAFCERHHLLRLAVFGSVLRDDFRTDGDDCSDIDVLVEFDPDHVPGWDYYGWGAELSALWGDHSADVLTVHELSRYFRQRVLDEAITLYERERSSVPT